MDVLFTRCCAGTIPVHFQVAEWRDVEAFPAKADGFIYSIDAYMKNHRAGGGWHEPDAVDYRRILADHAVTARISSRSIRTGRALPPTSSSRDRRPSGPVTFRRTRSANTISPTRARCPVPPARGSSIQSFRT
jgi:hypothetical protein